MKKLLSVLIATAVLGAWSSPAGASTGGPEAKTLRCKYKIARTLMSLGKKQMRIRSECGVRQAAGAIHSGVNCMGDPVDGDSTGSAGVDARLTEVRHRATVLGHRIGKKCDAPYRSPETVAMSQLCDPPVTDRSGWDDIMACGYELVTASSDHLSEMIYRKPSEGTEPISEEERFCRQSLGDFVRMAYRGRLRQRSDCFRRKEKNGAAYNCMATVAWPGRVEPVGLQRADRGLSRVLAELDAAIKTFCSEGIESMRFSENARISDPTASTPGGETFTTVDLYNVLADEIVREETHVITTMFPQGLTYCGDGFIDTVRGEQCDDGNQTSCDGCDRDCTISACLNGAACGPTEVCDDGNTLLQDGCDTACQLETCGDGIMQAGLGEGCDDGNEVDCDGCDSNCSMSSLCNNGVMCAANGEQCDEGLGICLSGYDELRPCVVDTDCRGICGSGRALGESCATNTDCAIDGTAACQQSLGCGGRCDGGANANDLCDTHSQCPGKCLPVAGAGQACASNADCPLGMRCNPSSTCELPRQGLACDADGDCGTGGFCEPSNGCALGNSSEVGDTCRDTCQLPMCGDGVTDTLTDTNGLGGEACDDGNTVDGDGCDSNCTVTECGNGIVTPGEDCDEGRGICAGGFDDNESCLLDTECRGFCFNEPNKACTPLTAVIDCDGQTCFPSSGCMGGNADSPTCRTDCRAAGCGDGILDPGEQCDDGPGVCSGGADLGSACASDADCRGLCMTGAAAGSPCFTSTDCGGGTCAPSACTGGNDDTPDTCRQNCLLPTCGDGVKDSTEACDGADSAACPGVCSTTCACP